MAKPRLPVHRCPTERVKLPRDVAMASVAIASLGCRRVLMDLATVLFPTVEDHVATLSSDSILEVNVSSRFRRRNNEQEIPHDPDHSQKPAARQHVRVLKLSEGFPLI